VQALPYVWPAMPDAASAREAGAGSCASKHALLAEELTSLGLVCTPLVVTGLLVPRSLSRDPDFAEGARLLEVHECLRLSTPWAGVLRLDVTWDPPLLARGLVGTRPWDGASDMQVAIATQESGWTVPRSELRSAKEQLRAQLYDAGQRLLRDRILARLSVRFASWRNARSDTAMGGA
jgi:hypothetical protein